MRKSIGHIISIGSFAFLIIASQVAAAPSDPIQEDQWYIATMQGQKCGYMHATMKREGQEVHSESTFEFELARASSSVKVKMQQAYRESLEGKPLGFIQIMNLGQEPITTKGEIKGKKITLVSEQLGNKPTTKDYPFDPQIKFAWGQLLEQRKRGLKPGTTFTVKSYDPTVKQDAPFAIELKVIGKEKVDVLGKPRELTKVTASMTIQKMRLTTESWVDDDANPVITSVDVAMMKIQMFLSTKEEALKKSKGTVPEMFMSTLITVKQKFDQDAKALTLRLTLPPNSKLILPDLPTTTMQSFKRISDYEGILSIHRIDWDKIRKVPASNAISGDMIAYTRASTIVDINDPRIKRLAKRAVGKAHTPAEKADALRKFATDYIITKNLDIGFATASEVAKTQTGDCTEHAVFLAALARACGMPSRGVSGIVAVPAGSMLDTGENAFGYHMWTQVYIGGQWVDIDAALRQTDCNPTHIALSLMPLNDEGMVESVMSLLPLMGRLKIDVVSEEKGPTKKIERPHKRG